MPHEVIQVEHGGGYRLILTFQSGERREVDISRLTPFDGVFEPLKNAEYFRRVAVNHDIGSIAWPNGADLCPDVLFSEGRALGAEHAA
jgi:hypothetical protein